MSIAVEGVTDLGRITHPAAIYDAARSLGELRWLWWPCGGTAEVAIGAASRLDLCGPSRFAEAAQAFSGERAIHCFGFADGASSGPWAGLPASLSATPRLWWRGDSLHGGHGEVSGDLDLAAALTRIVDDGPCLEPAAADHRVESIGGPAAFSEAVGAARAAIRSGAADKLVLSRSVRVDGLSGSAVRSGIERLAAASVGSTVFAVGDRDWDFVGATPEVLVRGTPAGTVESLPMAATVPKGLTDPARSLLADPKQRSEHALVVDAVYAGFAGLCRDVARPDLPEIVGAGEVVHLATPVRGSLRSGVSVLDLAAELHPTPAVGASPRSALGLVSELETTPRGYYTGVVGWTGPSGGELRVALRCGLIRGGRATLFAGAGIVAGSDPAAELEETRWKLRPMLDALLRV